MKFVTNTRKFFISGLLCLASMVAGPAMALEIIIDKGVVDPIPVAIVPFGWSQAETLPPIDLAAIISNDLERSARFATMDEADLPQRPQDYNSISFSDWRLLGMENLVIGKLIKDDTGNYQIDFRLVDVYKGKQIAGFRIPSTGNQLRRRAHEIADIIYEKLIGVRGAFATRIAYITVIKNRDGGKKYTLQIADADGYNPQILLESPEPLMSPDWSPDGKKLAYVSFEGKNSAIYLQDVFTGQREEVASNPGINSAPAWSPDGSRLAMTLSKEGNPDIYIMNLKTRQLRRVTTNPAIDTEPSWSSDGNHIIFTSDRGGSPQIYKIAINGGSPKRITFEGAYNARPIYSPDDKYVTMVHGNNGKYHIAIMDTASGSMNVLTDTNLDESPSFSPNGHMIIYARTSFSGTELAAVSADGQVRQRLALQKGEVREPSWGPYLNR